MTEREPVCRCGHLKSDHEGGDGSCRGCASDATLGVIGCPAFNQGRRKGAIRSVATTPTPFEQLKADVLAAFERYEHKVHGTNGKSTTFEDVKQIKTVLDAAKRSPQPITPKEMRVDDDGEFRFERACEREVLAAAAARYPKRATYAQLAILSGYSINSSGFEAAIGRLRRYELIEGSKADGVLITPAGLKLSPPPKKKPKGHELFLQWVGQLERRCEKELLRVLVESKRPMLFEDVVNATDSGSGTPYSIDSSGVEAGFSKLVALELVTKKGKGLNAVFEAAAEFVGK